MGTIANQTGCSVHFTFENWWRGSRFFLIDAKTLDPQKDTLEKLLVKQFPKSFSLLERLLGLNKYLPAFVLIKTHEIPEGTDSKKCWTEQDWRETPSPLFGLRTGEPRFLIYASIPPNPTVETIDKVAKCLSQLGDCEGVSREAFIERHQFMLYTPPGKI